MDTKNLLSIQMMRNGESRKVLHSLCEDIGLDKEKTMIEIGSYAGESTEIFAKYCKTIYAIDVWLEGMELTPGAAQTETLLMSKGIEDIFDLRIQSIPNIIKMKAFDNEVVDKFEDGLFDFIYIDALHTEEEVDRQIKSWLPKVKISGIIGGHDFCDYYAGVKRAVLKNVGQPDKVYNDVGNSWIKYRCMIR
jgi:predicted O-methyltransferase YrrM